MDGCGVGSFRIAERKRTVGELRFDRANEFGSTIAIVDNDDLGPCNKTGTIWHFWGQCFLFQAEAVIIVSFNICRFVGHVCFDEC